MPNGHEAAGNCIRCKRIVYSYTPYAEGALIKDYDGTFLGVWLDSIDHTGGTLADDNEGMFDSTFGSSMFGTPEPKFIYPLRLICASCY